jgi:hypothetical protein
MPQHIRNNALTKGVLDILKIMGDMLIESPMGKFLAVCFVVAPLRG